MQSTRRVAFVLSAWALFPSVRGGELPRLDSSSLPRYQLKVGQKLTYSFSSELTHESGSHKQKGKWDVWVVRKNEEGSSYAHGR